jgi:hypothetical protein
MKKVVRRWYFWLPALLLAAGVGYTRYRKMYPPWASTEAWANYQQIHEGMSFSQVRIAIGRPTYGDEYLSYPSTPTGARWDVDADKVCARFDADGRLARKWAVIQGRELGDPPLGDAPDERRLWNRVRTWLGW